MRKTKILSGGCKKTRSGFFGGGAQTFLGLSDTPNSYIGEADKVVKVKADQTGLEFTTEAAIDRHDVKATNTDADPQFLDTKLTVSGALNKTSLVLPPQSVDLAVKVDNSKIEINGSDQLSIKALSIANGDINAGAAIAESKLSLNYPTHSNANDPTSDQKAALAGTSGNPDAFNKYVTDQDARLSRKISKGGTLYNPSGITASVNIFVWRAPFSCTANTFNGLRVGGTGCQVNARKNGASNLLASNLSLTSTSSEMDGGTLQNNSFITGDTLEIMIISPTGSPTQIKVQVDFTPS